MTPQGVQLSELALRQWALPELRKLLPLNDGELEQILSYTGMLPDSEATQNLETLLGDSPESLQFIASYIEHRAVLNAAKQAGSSDNQNTAYWHTSRGTAGKFSAASSGQVPTQRNSSMASDPPVYDAPLRRWPAIGCADSAGGFVRHYHTNEVVEASNRRAVDEQQMQQMLQDIQYENRIYNSDIEPEHEIGIYCNCSIHEYQRRKWSRLGVQEMWSKAVMYPGEKSYDDSPSSSGLISINPYRFRFVSPYGNAPQSVHVPKRPIPAAHAQWISKTIALNNKLNHEAQVKVDAQEPRHSIWNEDWFSTSMENMSMDYKKRESHLQPPSGSKEKPASRFSSLKKVMNIRSSEEKDFEKANALRDAILAEEQGRWPDEQWRQIVTAYQYKVGMTGKIADLRARCPIQYLHLLRAGYLEPIPVAWANQASNPLKFSIEAASGWRGITPAWRGYEDLAEERLYWVLNHREGGAGIRMKPDFISEMNMAQVRMASAIEPPPLYYSADDTCQLQYSSAGYSKQVIPAPFSPHDRPETPTDDTMILLDVSGSMNMQPFRPVYDQYLVTSWATSIQPRNKDVAKAIIRRFTDAMANHHHRSDGYDLVTFSDRAQHVGKISHWNLDQVWREKVRLGGGTRVMTGWQEVKNLHFLKHSQSAIRHPVYGWQAGPETPMLRLLLLLDGEATDMDEFELDLLGLSWAHITIFLVGVDGCPHHHRHANELQRISDVNHHVSFVDAQGNCPERFVTHELLKRHLGYEVSMQEFEQMEQLPAYSAFS